MLVFSNCGASPPGTGAFAWSSIFNMFRTTRAERERLLCKRLQNHCTISAGFACLVLDRAWVRAHNAAFLTKALEKEQR